MKNIALFILIPIGLLLFVTQTLANDKQGFLVVSKMAGACGILDSLITFQETTRMEGGDAFVSRFYAVEAARLGISLEELFQKCKVSVETYDKLWEALGEK